MSAPVAGTRTTPTGIALENGAKCVFGFAALPAASLWELTCKPPGMDGGDLIDLTNMWNETVKTKAFQDVVDFTDSTFTFQYDPNIYSASQLLGLLNVATTVTIFFPDLSTLAFFGGLRVLEFDPLVRGTVPTGTATVSPTNRDPVAKTEETPVLTSVAGT